MVVVGDFLFVFVKFVLKRVLLECEQCFQKFYFMLDVKSNFKVEFGKVILNIKGWFVREE